MDGRPELRTGAHSSWALPAGGRATGWTQSWQRPKVLLIRTGRSRTCRHHTQGSGLGLTGKFEGLSACLLLLLSMLTAPQGWGPSAFRTGSVPSTKSLNFSEPVSLSTTWDQWFLSPREVVRMKKAADIKSLVHSMASSRHSTNISFFPSFLQIPKAPCCQQDGRGAILAPSV